MNTHLLRRAVELLNRVRKAAIFGTVAAACIVISQPLEAPAQSAPNAVASTRTVSYTECVLYTCNAASYTPEQVVQIISPAQRSAILNKDCKGLRSEYGKNLEDFPFELRDSAIIDCIDDRSIKLWVTENNYHRFLANRDSVTSVAEYHTYLKAIGYTSKKLVRS